MHKQCNYCGDYFFTSVSDRQFCSHICAHNAPKVKAASGVKILPRKKLSRLDGTDGLPCDICGILTFLPLLDLIRWHGKDKNVCRQCLSGLEVRAEEVNLDISDFLPVSLEME